MIKLIACDMDGTLLDSEKRLPAEFKDVLARLSEMGVYFAIASGRQYEALRRDFEDCFEQIIFICENGALVMHKGQRLLIDPIDSADIARIIAARDELSRVYPVLCRAETALIDMQAAESFRLETRRYYPSQLVVEDLSKEPAFEDVCKIAFYDEGDAQTHELPVLQRLLGDRFAVILSGENWVDVMKPGVHKGNAMRGLQNMLGIAPQECMAFGDYLNDCELLMSVGESYAMENAHPQLKAMAKYIAPSNDDNGVMRVIKERLSL